MSAKNVFFIVISNSTNSTQYSVLPRLIHRTLGEYLHQLERDKLVYNPTHGYEPYWVDGDWMFMEQKPKPNVTTTRKPTIVCGDECPYIYREVKHVCAHRTNNLIYSGCHQNCWGNWIDDLTRGFQTFDTYCDFLNAQCRSPIYDKWMFVHGGKCISNVEDYMKPISVGSQIVSRVTHYYNELSKARASLSLPPINFT